MARNAGMRYHISFAVWDEHGLGMSHVLTSRTGQEANVLGWWKVLGSAKAVVTVAKQDALS